MGRINEGKGGHLWLGSNLIAMWRLSVSASIRSDERKVFSESKAGSHTESLAVEKSLCQQEAAQSIMSSSRRLSAQLSSLNQIATR